MKIRLVNWINLVVAVICFVAAIVCFCTGSTVNIVIGIFDILAGSWNLFIFLHAVAVWWERSLKVAEKFAFTCPKCGHQFIPSFWTWFFVPHIGSRRYMKCEKCDKTSWMRRK